MANGSEEEFDINDEDPLPCPICKYMLRDCDCDPEKVEDAWEMIKSEMERKDTDV